MNSYRTGRKSCRPCTSVIFAFRVQNDHQPSVDNDTRLPLELWHLKCHPAPHRRFCGEPDTVTRMRSFIRDFKVLSRVIPGCSTLHAKLDDTVTGRKSKETIQWTDDFHASFYDDSPFHCSHHLAQWQWASPVHQPHCLVGHTVGMFRFTPHTRASTTGRKRALRKSSPT